MALGTRALAVFAAFALHAFAPQSALAGVPVVTSAGTASAKVGAPFSYQITASNSPTNFGAVGLPAGLRANPTTGSISGTPTAIDGNYTATITAKNSSGTGSNKLTIALAPTLPTVENAATAKGKVGSPLLLRITAKNWPRSFGAMGLPSGISVNPTNGVVSGTPAAAGNFTATLTAANGAGTAAKSITFAILPEAPVVTSPNAASAKVGTPFNYRITATNSPTTFQASGLPGGLALNAATGNITGTPTAIDKTYTVSLGAINAGGKGLKTLVLAVAPALPTIRNADSIVLTTGTALSLQILSDNFPRIFNASGLPAGLAINTKTGLVSGTPTTVGTSNVTLSATNGAGTAAKSLTMQVLPPKPVVTSAGSAPAKVGLPFSYKITATNSPASFAASGLPAGLSLNAATGNITGTPAVFEGTYTATISASNAGGTGSKQLGITVAAALPVIQNPGSISCTEGSPFSLSISATNFPKSFNAANLPPGLGVNSATGKISGIPATPGNRTATLYASNGAGSASKPLVFLVAQASIQISAPALPSAVLGAPYTNAAFTASGGWGGNNWSIPSGFLPPGMSLNAATGTLSGTPTGSAGTYAFAVRVQDSKLLQDEIDVLLEVVNPDTASRTAGILDVLPAGIAPQSAGNATFSTAYQPGNSTWAAGLNEQDVFLASITTPQYRLGIGKGGQVYSLRGAFGEGVAPQRSAAPWVDEVWQFVATNTDLVTPIHAYQALSAENRQLGFPMQFFIHQSGIYLSGLAGNTIVGAASKPFYSPALKTSWDPATRTFSVVSWSQMARSPNVWKSGMLTYASYRDLGNGAVEATNVVTNFGEQDLKFINTPWGGVRQSSLPTATLSTAAGGYSVASGAFASAPVQLRNTGGWHAWTQTSLQNGVPSLALVFGKDAPPGGLPNWRAGYANFRYGTAGTVLDRNYQVAEASATVRLQKGQTMAARWHLVADGFLAARNTADSLVPFAGIWMPNLDSTAASPVWISGGEPSDTGSGEPSTHLYAQPIPGTVPVFAMEDTRTGGIFATFDPYTLTPTAPFPNPLPANHPERARYQNRVLYYQYESPGAVRKLLGYARRENLPGGGCTRFELPGPDGSPLTVWGPPRPDGEAVPQP
jgi:hypothetical protein